MSAQKQKLPVVIVGGGPIGLAMHIELGQRGIRSLLVEQGDGTIEHPRTGLVAIRTMEAFRRWGIAEPVRACGFPQDYQLSMVFCTSLTGLLLDCEPYPSMREAPTPPETPEKKQRCPQLWLQPILTRAAQDNALGELAFHHRFERFEQLADGVRVELQDLRDGSQRVVEAEYVLACDGATSQVRAQAGLEMAGRLLSYSVNILLHAPGLADRHPMGEAERYLFVGADGMWGNLTVVDGADIWRLTVLGSEEKMRLDDFVPDDWVRRALGPEGADIPYEIRSVTPWRRSEMLANQFAKGRVILVGDAAHTMSPTGGMGMNTGIQEVLDLGWKLQGAIQGWGGPGLIESYSIERRPVAERNIRFSTQNFRAWQDTPSPLAVCDDTPAGAATRQAIGKRLRESTRVEWESMGLQIGYRYEGSPICLRDGTPATPDDFQEYVPTARPGSRAPHAWLRDGRSILDLFGPTFMLLDFSGADGLDTSAQVATEPLAHAFSEHGVPFQTQALDDPAIARLYEFRYVLVRPDGHVAWRGNTIDDPNAIANTVRGALTTQPASTPAFQ